MNHEIVIAAMRLLTGLLEALRAFWELLRQRREDDDGRGRARKRPRHLKK